MLSFVGRKPFVRQRILEAAFDLFAKEGFEAISTRAIAEKAEVGPASMFKHFPTKENLGRELYRVALAPLLKDFAELAEKKPEPHGVIGEAVRILYAAYDHRPRALALLIFPPHELTPWEVDPANADSIRAILKRLLAIDDDLAAIVWGAITGPLQDRYLRRRGGTMSPFAKAHAALIKSLIGKSKG